MSNNVYYLGMYSSMEDLPQVSYMFIEDYDFLLEVEKTGEDSYTILKLLYTSYDDRETIAKFAVGTKLQVFANRGMGTCVLVGEAGEHFPHNSLIQERQSTDIVSYELNKRIKELQKYMVKQQEVCKDESYTVILDVLNIYFH